MTAESLANQWICIRTYRRAIEAEVARTALEAHSIPARVIANDDLGRYIPLPPTDAQLFVLKSDADKAERLLDGESS